MRLLILLITLFYFSAAPAGPDTLTIQQTLFLQARSALQQHNNARFQTLAFTLQGYVLYPYLVYWQLLQNIDQISQQQINAFAKEYNDVPLTNLLREKWAAAHLPSSSIISITKNSLTTPTTETLIRNAITQQDWVQVNKLIAQLSSQQRATSTWQYWHAYALAKQNNLAAANSIYKKLATQMDYYGWLASEQLNSIYNVGQAAAQRLPDNFVRERVAHPDLQNNVGIQRAHELYILQFYPDARREWNWEINTLNNDQLIAAAYLAQQWGWYDRAIITAAKIPNENDLTLRFPLAYDTEIKTAAKKFNLDPAWVFAIARQESGFTPDLKSNAGAFGLMQVMPHTAHLLTKDFSLPIHTENNFALLNINTNIQLGCAYLKQLLGWFKGNIVLATAAYNIGPTALQKHLADYKTLGDAAWIETLPWRDTREYVKDVLLAKAVYRQQLNQ
jgi:soluble lytic murein transglycosylase